MKRLHLIAALQLLLLIPSMAFSAPKVKSVKSFRAIVPDTVIQGDTFTVAYALEATHWKEAHVKKGSGLILTDLKWDRHQGTPYWVLIAKAKYITSRVGRITLPPMSAEIDGEEVLSEPKEVFVKSHPQYGEEMTLAHEWLIKKGIDRDSLTLDFSALVGNFFFFSDQRHECFCLVAKKDTWNYAGNPIWAYSLECGMGEKSLKEYIPYFFKDYSELLTAFEQSGKKMHEFDDDIEPVLPLLGELQWGQSAPYNEVFPTKQGKRVVVGCVPLSMAMIMNYYRWPKQGSSTVSFESAQELYDFDCTEIQPKWEQYKSHYEETEECTELSTLLGALSLIMDAQYVKSGTAVALNHVKHIMCNNLGYSGRIFLYEKPSCQNAYKLLKQEIVNHHPCIVSKNEHAFVCDGLEKSFFHFNLGWQGQGNGYYRVPKYTVEEDSTFFRAIIAGIEPQKSEQKKEVTLKEKGTLAELLSDEEKENLTSLTISGPINSSDIRLIRAMAGAKGDSLYDNRKMGTLRFLELTNAVISKDKIPYRTKIATKTYSGYKYSGAVPIFFTPNYTFDFNNMNKNEWFKFKTNFANIQKGKGLRYTRVNDTKYYESSFCIKNTISSEMFSDCSSLCEIRIPKKTKAIFDAAFLNCSSIQEIQIPVSTKYLGEDVFKNCLSLKKMYVLEDFWPVGSSSVFLSRFANKLSPSFEIETYRP